MLQVGQLSSEFMTELHDKIVITQEIVRKASLPTADLAQTIRKFLIGLCFWFLEELLNNHPN